MANYRTIWISDLHLGSRGCNAEALLQFLQTNTCSKLYLVGDIIDGWALKRNIYWPKSHEAVVQHVLRMARHGTEVIYIPGNHDETLRNYVGHELAGVTIVSEHIHETVGGKKILCLHGDDFDVVTKYHKWVAVLGDMAYESLLVANRYFNNLRKILGFGYWSLSSYVKLRVKEAVSFISDYRESVMREARKREVDAVLCGHIHHPEISFDNANGLVYLNTGDWVESCSAIAEQWDGKLLLLRPDNKSTVTYVDKFQFRKAGAQ